MSTYGVGQGLDRGVRMASDLIMKGLEMKQKAAHFQQAMDFNLDWARGIAGLGPMYAEEEAADQEAADQAAATRPAIPSSTPITTPGPMGVPQSRFDTGRQVQPMPAAALTGGAMGLLLRRPSNMGLMPRLRRGY